MSGGMTRVLQLVAEKYVRVVQLHLRRNAARDPVMDALSPNRLVEPEQFCHSGRSAKIMD